MQNFTEKELNERLGDLIGSGVFGDDFELRPKQKETILTLAQACGDDETENMIIDAPTGTGKSILAIVTGKLLESLDYKGYILTSDLALQNQYAKDFARMNLRWGNIMGVDNYNCDVNDLKFSLGECRIRNMSYKQAESLACFHSCGYLQNRKGAIESNVSLLNYSYWLLQRNYVAKKQEEDDEDITFPQRDFVFFDEAHKINDIVQNHFAPLIDYSLVDKAHDLYNGLRNQGINLNTQDYSRSELYSIVEEIIESDDKTRIKKGLKVLHTKLNNFVLLNDVVKTKIRKLFSFEDTPTSDWRRITMLMDQFKDVSCKVEDFNEIIDDVGVDKMIKVPNSEDSVTLKCLEERHLIDKYLLDKAGFKVFMSATIGDPERYMLNAGIKSSKMIRIGNTFDFSKSPIHLSKKYRFNYANKEKVFPSILKLHDNVLAKVHPNQKGIVHTGSYNVAHRIQEESKIKGRIISYSNSVEKKEALQRFELSDNGVLIGPSLLEGLDFMGDESRFQIFFKVPYPSLADPFIKAKLNENQGWYDYKTSVGILQGVGRSVRDFDDWAATYFLDACFYDFYNRNQKLFPPWFKERIQS